MNNLSLSCLARISLCFALAGCFLCGMTGCDGFIQGYVKDESGFDGAVTVLSAGRDGACGVVTVRVPYRDLYGNAREGRARMVVHRSRVFQEEPLPAFCHVHYEMNVGAAKKWAERGWAVFTAEYNAEAPIAVSMGDGYNQARAILQWVRRCPFIDGARLHLDGGSQGGYMALAMSADMFPVTSATADAPVVNWAYNFGYFEVNRALVAGFAAPMESPLPVFASVLPLADMAYEHFPRDLADDTWFYISPVAQVNRITNPVLVTIATGDMLVPMEQITRAHIHPHDPGKFPDGYVRDFEHLTPSEKPRVRLEDVAATGTIATRVMPLQEHSYLVSTDMRLNKEPRPSKKPAAEDRPWSKEHQWNICILDEGPPEPFADHTTYAWDTVPDSYVDHHYNATPGPDLLNDAKLHWLLERYTATMNHLPLLRNGSPANRRNFDYLEKRDVLNGLLVFAKCAPACEERLNALYAASDLKPFGPVASLPVLRQLLEDQHP